VSFFQAFLGIRHWRDKRKREEESMASLKDAEQLTKGLEDLVGQLRSELTNGKVDFEKLVSISDQISESADGLAETFSNVNDALMSRIDQASGAARKAASKAGSGGG
jgi:ABC-type transporter Mla subunit MlaD